MAVELIYKHQRKTYDLMREELKRSGRAAFEFPTGCGKTFPGLKYIDENPDKNALIIVPSTAIKSQWEKYIRTYVENGIQRLKNKNIVIVTYQKIAFLSKKVKSLNPNMIIIDELHRMGAETWEPAIDTLIENNPEAEVIAMTATPRRTDKRNIAEEKFGENIVYEMSLTEALSGEKEDEVVLRTPRYVRILSQFKKRIIEYKERILSIEDDEKRKDLLEKYERLETIISNSPDIRDIMALGIQKKNGKYIVFCKNREDMMEKMAQAHEIFGKVNPKICMEYVLSRRRDVKDELGKSEKENRKTLEKFEKAEPTDELQLLFCVDKLNEGIHIEGIDGIVLFDLTNSPVLYKQRIGRATTTDRETVIIDAVNNWLAQIDTYREVESAIIKGKTRQHKDSNKGIDYDLFRLSPEETELLTILEQIGEGLRETEAKTYEEIIKWLETHEGNLPRSTIFRDGRELAVKELTKQEQYERNLYARWSRSEERKILKEYAGKDIEEVPEEYREQIRELRKYGLGGKTTYDQMIEWLETHNGKMPGNHITRNGKKASAAEMTEEEKKGVQLYDRWRNSKEKKILMEYIGRDIEEVPEEYREKIRILREYGYGVEEKTTCDLIIQWLESHEGNLPRTDIGRKKRIQMTPEEQYEVNLRQRWDVSCIERKILIEYVGRDIEEVPEEYREKIRVLREFGYGLKEKTTYERIVEWLEKHQGNLPRATIARDEGGEQRKKRNEMTEEERSEVNLRQRWDHYCIEKNVLTKYEGKDIEEVPEEYREKIRILRNLLVKTKTLYEEIIEWLETHEGKMPNGNITRNGRKLKIDEMTEEEKRAKRLYSRWHISKERKILDEYAGRPIEDVPDEYREKIAKLRSLGQLGTKKDNQVTKRMKKAVGNQVEENSSTRIELTQPRQVNSQSTFDDDQTTIV